MLRLLILYMYIAYNTYLAIRIESSHSELVPIYKMSELSAEI